MILGNTDDPAGVPQLGPEIVHAQFSLRAREQPTAPALECGAQVLTFGELEERTDALAARLRSAGVRVEDRVAVCLEPALDLVVAQLAVLKAGAAYVPLDPGYPAERIRYLLTDSQATVVVTCAELAARLPEAPLQLWAEEPPATPEDFSAALVHPDNTACVIHTSGSTGEPKGVSITHRGLVHLTRCARERFALRPGDRFLQMASISFSAFLEEVYPTLLAGATVVLAGHQRALSSTQNLLEALERHRVTAFGITTALWHVLTEDLTATGERLPAGVRFVLMGGEAARPDRVRQWAALGTPLIHVYGPTEATVTATYLHTDEYVLGVGGDWTLPIGRVIPRTGVYLLNAELGPVAPGEAGELYIGGLPVARGYLGRPARTAERFLPDPFGEPGARMYRTGDTGRVRNDGELEFIGRADGQFKVNGYRIEPAEIEAVIERHPAVRSACVLAVRDAAGDNRIVAHVVAAQSSSGEMDLEEVRRQVTGSLPRYLHPHRWVAAGSLPLTQNGKVDRAALIQMSLPSGAGTRGNGETDGADEVEKTLAGIWATVLGVPQVGVTDDFFDLGGDSLKAARTVSRIRAALGVELPLREVFEQHTVRAVADLVSAADDCGRGTAGRSGGTSQPTAGARPACGAGAGGSCRGVAALGGAAGAVVPQRDAAGQPGLQHPVVVSVSGPARHRCNAFGARVGGGKACDPAVAVPHCRRNAHPHRELAPRTFFRCSGPQCRSAWRGGSPGRG